VTCGKTSSEAKSASYDILAASPAQSVGELLPKLSIKPTILGSCGLSGVKPQGFAVTPALFGKSTLQRPLPTLR